MEVSIIIPCYNKEQYIEACIQSILTQEFRSFEIIMVDDGSTDRTGYLCDQIATLDTRVKVYHTSNGGVTAARKFGFDHSTGKYIMFVDCDDQLMPNAIQTLYDNIERTQADEVIGAHKTQMGTICDSGLRGWQDTSFMINDLLALHNSFCVLWGIIFRKDILTGCLDTPRDIINGEDIMMQIKVLMKNPKVYFIEDLVYLYNYGLPNNRAFTLARVQLFDTELKQTLLPRWEEFRNGYLLHCIKTYENHLWRRNFDIKNYYRPLKKENLSHIPIKDRIAFCLPLPIAYWLVWIKKKMN